MYKQLICTVILIFSYCAMLSAQTHKHKEHNEFKEVLELQFEESTVFQFDTKEILDQRADKQQGFFTKFSIGDKYEWTLALEPNQIKSEDYKLRIANEEGIINGITSHDIYTFKGIVHGTDHEVRLTILEDYIYGYIETEDDAVFIEPLNNFEKGSGEDLFVAYKASEVIEGAPISCGVTEMRERGKSIHKHEHSQDTHNKIGEASSRTTGNCYELEIAYANDFPMFEYFQSVPAIELHVISVLNNVQGNYDDEFSDEIQLSIVEIFIPTSSDTDPFSSVLLPGALLSEFETWAQNGFTEVHDIGVLWTGRAFNGQIVGLASLASVCSHNRYHLLENVGSTHNYSAPYLRALHAHEMGHNFSFTHDDESSPTIMAPLLATFETWSAQSQDQFDWMLVQVIGPDGCLSACAPPAPPVAAFTPNYNSVCLGSYVTFFDHSSENPTSWSWSMPGAIPSTSTERNPTVLYNYGGTFDVTLTVSNANGSSAETLQGLITVGGNGGTDIFFYEGFESGAGQFSIDNPDGNKTWESIEVQGAREGHRAMYVRNNHYSVIGQEDALVSPTLDFSGKTNTSIDIEYAYASYSPTTFDSLKVFISTNGGGTYTTIFGDSENGTWNFATGISEYSPFTPSHESDWCFGTLNGPGCLSLDLSAYDGMSDVVIKIVNKNDYGNNMYVDNVRIKSSCIEQGFPAASFTNSVNEGCYPMEVSFTDESDNNPTSWEWSFPGGNPSTSNAQHPTIIYETPGTYPVTLLATNDVGTGMIIASEVIIVFPTPTASFTDYVTANEVVFTNTSEDALSYNWSFGDGAFSTSFAPIHTYAEDGVYIVELIATNSCGSDTVISEVVINNSIPVADFSSDTDISCAGLPVNFHNLSSANSTSWMWTFEGGTPSTSTEEHPTIVFENPGVYGVSLVATNASGSHTLSLADFIMVESELSVDFVYTASGFDVSFINNAPEGLAYYWDFGDGQISEEEQPSHIYSSNGIYTIVLSVTNHCGTFTTEQNVAVSNSDAIAYFELNEESVCAGSLIQFTNLSSENSEMYEWLFFGALPLASTIESPFVTYDEPGVYTVLLTALNSDGGSLYEAEIVVEAEPVVDFDFTQSGDLVSFTNNSQYGSSYAWDFGDGNISNEISPEHIYDVTGSYEVELIVYNGCGSDTLVTVVDHNTVSTAEMNELGSLSVYPNPTTGSFEFAINLTDQSNKQIRVSLLDVLGRQHEARDYEIFNSILNARFDISNLPSGLYYLTFESGQKKTVERIIKL